MTSVLGKTVELPKLWSALRLHIPTSQQENVTDEHEVADSLSTLPLRYIRYAHPSYYLHLQACTPNDPRYGNQLSLDNSDTDRTHINAEQAWCFLDSTDDQKGKSDVRVGIFDTGISASHPDFVFGGGGYPGSVVDGGQRFLNGAQTTVQYSQPDPQGHGSKSGGMVAAIRNNGTGIAGIAGGDVGKGEGEGVHLYDLRTFTTDFFGTTAKMPDLADALMWSLTAGPNNSPLFPLAHHGYGFLLNDIQVNQPNVDLFREVWQTAFRAEVTSVVSRGNAFEADPTVASSIPATFTIDSIQEPSFYFDDWNLSVGASQKDGNIAKWLSPDNPDPFSSYFGKSVDMIAPGISSMLETTNEQSGYSDFNGTSAAAPHVTGAAALLMSYSEVPLAPEDVEHLLQYGAVPKSTMDSTGWGLLDVYASLKLIQQPEYRVIHFDTILTGGGIQVAPSTITIRLTADYDTIEAGIYQAIPYQHVATFSYDLGPSASLAALSPNKPPFWIRNSGSRLWGPNGTLVGGTSQYVVPVDRASFFSLPTASSATVSGYYYEVFLSPTESVVIPYGADTHARLGFSLLAYNPEGFPTDLEDELPTAHLGLKLFPNPTSGTSTLEYALSSMQTVDLQLLDLSGRELWGSYLGRVPGGTHQHEIPTTNLLAGIYLLRLRTGEQSSYVKLIKQ
jgi:subtilisin family serine protease